MHVLTPIMPPILMLVCTTSQLSEDWHGEEATPVEVASHLLSGLGVALFVVILILTEIQPDAPAHVLTPVIPPSPMLVHTTTQIGMGSR